MGIRRAKQDRKGGGGIEGTGSYAIYGKLLRLSSSVPIKSPGLSDFSASGAG